MDSVPDKAEAEESYPAELHNPRHVAYLEARANMPTEVCARGERTVQAGQKKKQGPNSAHYYGFSPKWGGLLLPLCPIGDVESPAYQIRYFESNIGETGGPPAKFMTPRGQPNRLCCAPAMREHLQAGRDYDGGLGRGYIIVEGITRVDALAGLGVPAIGITGIDSWKGKNQKEGGASTRLADWDEVGKGSAAAPMPFTIIPDGDVWTNADVNASVRALARFLESAKGAAKPVKVLRVPQVEGDPHTGLDDWIAALRREGQTVAEIKAQLLEQVVTVNELPQPGQLKAMETRLALDRESEATPTQGEVQAQVEALPANRKAIIETLIKDLATAGGVDAQHSSQTLSETGQAMRFLSLFGEDVVIVERVTVDGGAEVVVPEPFMYDGHGILRRASARMFRLIGVAADYYEGRTWGLLSGHIHGPGDPKLTAVRAVTRTAQKLRRAGQHHQDG